MANRGDLIILMTENEAEEILASGRKELGDEVMNVIHEIAKSYISGES